MVRSRPKDTPLEPPMKFFLGIHRPNWLAQTSVPLFVSRRVLTGRRTLPVAQGEWALDSGGFTELSLYGRWETTPEAYASDVLRFEGEVGGLAFVAPQDWMCEPHIVAKTGLSVPFHQQLTIENFLDLRERLGALVIPVLQGWTLRDYEHCWGGYEDAGVDLAREPLVGLGSVCRRQNMTEAGLIVRQLASEGLRLHGFGVKLTGLESYSDALESADSMAWSYGARRDSRAGLRRSCGKTSCANCLHHALDWRKRVVEGLGQLRLEAA